MTSLAFTPFLSNFIIPSAFNDAVDEPDLDEIEYSKDKVEITIDVPGCKLADLKLSMEENKLKLDGHRKIKTTKGDGVKKRRYSRTIVLKNIELLDVLNISASLTDGVLTVTIPRKEKPAPITIPITVRSTEAKGKDNVENGKSEKHTGDGQNKASSEETES